MGCSSARATCPDPVGEITPAVSHTGWHFAQGRAGSDVSPVACAIQPAAAVDDGMGSPGPAPAPPHDRDGEVISTEDAGEYALDVFPARWHPPRFRGTW